MSSTQSSSTTEIDIITVNPSIDKLKAQKLQLQKDIKKLELVIDQLKYYLETRKYRHIDKHTLPKISFTNSSKCIIPVELEIQNELYKYSGLYCTHFTKDRYLFNICSSCEQQENNTYAIEIIKQNNIMKLGKWVMPMSVDGEQLQEEVNFQKSQNVRSFMKNCKHHVNCYNMRHEQFANLEHLVADLQNCNLHSNWGYTQVILELFQVLCVEADEYINLIIYLQYKSKEARPNDIKVELYNKKELNKNIEKQLLTSLKIFRTKNLQTAFEKIFTIDDPYFTWIRKCKDDDILELTSSSDSEDKSIQNLKEAKFTRTKRKRSKRQAKDHAKKHKVVSKLPSTLMTADNSSSTTTKKHEKTKEAVTTKKVSLRWKKLNSTLNQAKCKPNTKQMPELQVLLNKMDKKLLTSTPLPNKLTALDKVPNLNISKITVD